LVYDPCDRIWLSIGDIDSDRLQVDVTVVVTVIVTMIMRVIVAAIMALFVVVTIFSTLIFQGGRMG
jgi:hypothetical protein